MQRFPFLLFRAVCVLGAVALLSAAYSSSDSESVASTNTDLDCSEQSRVSAGKLDGHSFRGEQSRSGLVQLRAF